MFVNMLRGDDDTTLGRDLDYGISQYLRGWGLGVGGLRRCDVLCNISNNAYTNFALF